MNSFIVSTHKKSGIFHTWTYSYKFSIFSKVDFKLLGSDKSNWSFWTNSKSISLILSCNPGKSCNVSSIVTWMLKVFWNRGICWRNSSISADSSCSIACLSKTNSFCFRSLLVEIFVVGFVQELLPYSSSFKKFCSVICVVWFPLFV